MLCRRLEGKRSVYPGLPPLPQSRVLLEKPFEKIDVHFSGEIIITGDVTNEPTKV